MTSKEFVDRLEDILGTPVDQLIEQARETLQGLLPAEEFAEWDTNARAVQAQVQKWKDQTEL